MPLNILEPLKQKLLQSNEVVTVGRFSYGNPKIVMFRSSEPVKIGSFCSIADEVTLINGGEHFTENFTTYPLNALFSNADLPWFEKSKGSIEIGNDVWIGYGATILSGVTIGDGAVIGAGSVVAKDVEPYSIVAGNPAKLIRMRFCKHNIDALLSLQWWNWPIERIEAEAYKLMRHVE